MSEREAKPSAASSIETLVQSIRTILQDAGHDEPVLKRIVDEVYEQTRRLPPANELPVSDNSAALKHLPNALDQASSGPAATMADTLRVIGLRLPWQYSYADGDPSLASQIAFAEVVGPRGPVLNSEIRLGFTLIGPRTYYPLHAHPAVELYYVVTGRSWWTAGVTTSERTPGSCILHPGEIPHATRTESETMLAVYAWVGDIMAPSRYI